MKVLGDERPQLGPSHQYEIFGLRPFLVPSESSGSTKWEIEPVQDGQSSMMFDGEIAMRNANKRPSCNSQAFGDETALGSLAAEVLQYGI